MHYPETTEEEQELLEAVSIIHAQAVIQYLKKMPYSKKQKAEIIKKLLKD